MIHVDYVYFRENYFSANGDLIFYKNFEYRLIGEKDGNYHISPDKEGNKFIELPRKLEGELFDVC